MSRLARFLRRFRHDQKGVAAIEMALVSVMISGALINAVEVGRYATSIMQVQNAAQAGIAAANHSCDSEHLPATLYCATLTAAVTAAVTSTSLGDRVSVKGPVTEGWYCSNGATKALQYMAAVSAKPADCSAAANPSGAPGLYLRVDATYAYEPIFPGMTIADRFASPLTRTAVARML
jgi:Flp pilus assembly protein TadG